MIILIDNYDSFTFNIYHYVSQLNRKVEVYRNDKISIKEIIDLNPEGIIISPGPGVPEEAGICVDLIKKVYKTIPILGICLGHQAIGKSFGGNIIIAPNIMHGKISDINHNNHKIFFELNSTFKAARYHSLIIENSSIPKELNIIAKSSDNLIMGISHNNYKTFGLQFHPESIGTKKGKIILENFLKTINYESS